MRKKTTEEFVADAKKVHGDNYFYTKVEYKGNRQKVRITCPLHGDFEQVPHVHLRGGGCPKCGQIVRNRKNIKFNEKIFDEINKKFGFEYDFSQFEYKGYDVPCIVICPIHGEFKQSLHKLKYGHGCQKCGNCRNISENNVLKILKENFENVEYQKKFPWLKNKKQMSLDFFLPDYNTAIEYQGRQHFCESTRFKSDHENTVERDLLKIKLCKENGVKIYHLTFENKYIPKDFSVYQIFIDINELITAIKQD